MSLDIGLPQILLLGLMALGAGVRLAQYGKPNTGTYNFYTALIAKVITVGILIWGGFFAVMEWPQIVIILIMMVDLGAHLVLHGEKPGGTYGCGGTIISNTVFLALLYAGGFFTTAG